MCVVNPEIVAILSLHCLTSHLILHHISAASKALPPFDAQIRMLNNTRIDSKYLMKISVVTVLMLLLLLLLSVETQGVTLGRVKVSSRQTLPETCKAFLGDFLGIPLMLQSLCHPKEMGLQLFPNSVQPQISKDSRSHLKNMGFIGEKNVHTILC